MPTITIYYHEALIGAVGVLIVFIVVKSVLELIP